MLVVNFKFCYFKTVEPSLNSIIQLTTSRYKKQKLFKRIIKQIYYNFTLFFLNIFLSI